MITADAPIRILEIDCTCDAYALTELNRDALIIESIDNPDDPDIAIRCIDCDELITATTR